MAIRSPRRQPLKILDCPGPIAAGEKADPSSPQIARIMPRGRRNISRNLLDHLVGGRQDYIRDYEIERLRCVEIDGELEFGRLSDGQIAGLLSAQDAVDKVTGAAELKIWARPIGKESARRGVFL